MTDFSQIENSILQVKKRDGRVSNESHHKIKSVLLVLLFFIIPFTISNVYADSGSTSNTTDPKVTSSDPPRGEVMISSATLIGFAGFGSILALRLQGEQMTGQIVCSIIMFVAILVEIILHLYVMWAAYVNDLVGSLYASIMIVTMFMVGIIVICFAVITVFQYGYKTKDKDVDHIAEGSIKNTTSAVYEEKNVGCPIKNDYSKE